MADISLFVVDEAHSDLRVGTRLPARVPAPRARRSTALGRPPVLALTATAAPPVRDEIVERLGLRSPECPDPRVRPPEPALLGRALQRRAGRRAQAAGAGGADRGVGRARDRLRLDAARGRVAGRARCAERLCAYHAGMKPHERDDVQERFMDGALDVVVATTAFGMGIDKHDVRWVFHAEVAESLDAYYQEIGPRRPRRRARRDRPLLPLRGRRAAAVLRGWARRGRRDRPGARRGARGAAHPVGADVLQHSLSLSQTKLASALARLEDAGALHVRDRRRGRGRGRRRRPTRVLRAAEAEEMRRSFDRSRVDMMRAYAEIRRLPASVPALVLRRAVRAALRVLRQLRGGAGARRRRRTSRSPSAPAWSHGQWGAGVVQRYDDDSMVVLFDEAGYKTLALAVVRERAILDLRSAREVRRDLRGRAAGEAQRQRLLRPVGERDLGPSACGRPP